jgi:hypothetical protein
MEGEEMDKLMVWGAWSLMAAVASLSAWKISQAPKIEPEIVRLEKELTDIQNSKGISCGPAAPKVPVIPPPLTSDPKAGTAPASDWTAFIMTKAVGIPVPIAPTNVFLLPLPKISPEAKADLDGVSIRWDLEMAKVQLQPWMIRKDALPEKFIIERQCEDGSVEVIAELGPKARSFTDLSTEPRLTYRYWVSLVGKETDLSKRPLVEKPAIKGQNDSTEARTPSATRLKLIGGEKDAAILRVETYDRARRSGFRKRSSPPQASRMPDWAAGASTDFDSITLRSWRTLTDDEGVDRVLTTKD